MNNVVERLTGYSYRIGSPGTQPARKQEGVNRQGRTQRQSSFAQVLQNQLAQQSEAVKFSAHAVSRLHSRRIQLTPKQFDALSEAVDRAAGKGCRESLILMGDLAFVVSIKNRTVITVVDGERMQDNVFTNIDSAVVTR